MSEQERKWALAEHLEEDSKVVRENLVGDQHTGLVGFCLLLESTKVKLKHWRGCSWLFILVNLVVNHFWGKGAMPFFFCLTSSPTFPLFPLFNLMIVRVQHVNNYAKQNEAYIDSLICK